MGVKKETIWGYNWGKRERESIIRIIFENIEEAQLCMKNIKEYDALFKDKEGYDFIHKACNSIINSFNESDSYHDGKPTAVIYDRFIPSIVLAFLCAI